MLVFVSACTRKRVRVFPCEGIHKKKVHYLLEMFRHSLTHLPYYEIGTTSLLSGNYWLFRVKLAIENSQHYAARNTSCGDDCSQRDLDNVDPSRRIGLDAIDRQMSH